MVSTRPPISKPYGPFNSPLFTVPNAPITTGIIVTSIIIIIIIIIIIFFEWEHRLNKMSEFIHWA